MISILVPIYSVEKYIERCVRSLFEQTYSDIEYVFVNDCSPDSSMEILTRIMSEYPHRIERIKIINHKENQGLAAARNTAIANATGEFILHVDSDDYLEIAAVEKLVKKQKETQADIVTGQAIQHTSTSWFIMERPQFKNKTDFVLDMIKPTIHHTIWGRLIRKALYKDYQLKAKEGINIGEDLQIMSQLAFYGHKFISIPEVVYHYDTRNMGSYMNSSTDKRKRIFRLSQDIESMKVVYHFFKKNDSTYLDEIAQYMKTYLISIMKEYCLCGNKLDFEISKKELKKYNTSFTIKEKIISCNYYICKFLLTLKKYKNEII